MTITKRGQRLQQIDQEIEVVRGQVVAEIQPAADEVRCLTEHEYAVYTAGAARLDELLAERRALVAQQSSAGDAPPSKNKQNGPDVNARLRKDKLELEQSKAEQIDAKIIAHENSLRTRDLQKNLERIEADQGIAERQAELDYRRRMGQLLDAQINWTW
jgi:hypothetical protein